MLFNLLTVNHGGMDVPPGVADLISHMEATLSLCGHDVIINHNSLIGDGVNLFFENFVEEAGVQYLIDMKKQNAVKIGIIATELVLNDQIPYAEHGIQWPEVAGAPPEYRKDILISKRLHNLGRLVETMDFTWCLLERTAHWYQRRSPSVFFLPVGSVNHLDENFRRAPKNIDVLFFGTATPHRIRALTNIQQSGINVVPFGRGFSDGFMPPIYMNSLLNRAKIGLNLTLHARDEGDYSGDPRFVSCMRVVDLFARELCIVSEAIPYDNPYQPYMRSGEIEELGGICKALLDSGDWAKLGKDNAHAFRRDMDVRQVCKPIIDQTLSRCGWV